MAKKTQPFGGKEFQLVASLESPKKAFQRVQTSQTAQRAQNGSKGFNFLQDLATRGTSHIYYLLKSMLLQLAYKF